MVVVVVVLLLLKRPRDWGSRGGDIGCLGCNTMSRYAGSASTAAAKRALVWMTLIAAHLTPPFLTPPSLLQTSLGRCQSEKTRVSFRKKLKRREKDSRRRGTIESHPS
eukprot:Gregarina_sp_Pseudo_9__1268@NODE_1841_length_1299_cov_5_400000_g1707_i0_p2_GENE_NODE_1841_length_1299_cov_5_400000_g1707_i0NODE_1841_length_1299_cov_5_400000_g1707_i0_p2_ORF_typecomplete_len108_score10_98_NODE_1841_length_1299_cov_5_400000_g1707_i08371160